MEALEFARLERIARNLPVWPGTMTYGQVVTELGPVYIALGRGYGQDEFAPICWHGIYAINYGEIKGMCRPGQVPGSASRAAAQQAFLDDAMWFLEQMDARAMNDRSYNLGGPRRALRFGH